MMRVRRLDKLWGELEMTDEERLEEIGEPFADLEKIKINILKGKILDGLDEFKSNKRQQWTELRFEEPLLVKLLFSIEQAERVETLENREEVRKVGAEANSKYYGKIEHQNKRYRELFARLLNSEIDDAEEYADLAEQTAWEALEELE